MLFKFKMQKVLEYRELLEEQAKISLANVLRMLQEEKDRLDDMQILVQDSEKKLYDEPIGNFGERWLLEHYIKGLREDLAMSHMRVRNLNDVYIKAHTDFIFRAKERKVLDKLKSKQTEQHNKDESIKEQREYDETTTIRYKPKSL